MRLSVHPPNSFAYVTLSWLLGRMTCKQGIDVKGKKGKGRILI